MSRIQKKRVMVLYTGGNFGMMKNEENLLVPIPNVMLEFLKTQKVLHDAELAEKFYSGLQSNQLVLPIADDTVLLYEFKEYVPLQNSCNMTSDDWINMATDVGRYYEHFDGIVIIQGTGTMAYTASALSFMLEGLNKPIILTGSQIPIFELRTDAKENFVNAAILAACYKIPEVCICFAGKLMRGNRTSYRSCQSLDTFESYNYHYLAKVGVSIDVYYDYIRPAPREELNVNTNLNTNIAILWLSPTLSSSTVESVMKSAVEAVILETYGFGRFSTRDEEILKILRWATQRGIIILYITQCLHGTTDVKNMAGMWLSGMDAVCGGDMTCEAAVTKLCYVLGMKHLTRKEKIAMLGNNLRGEMSDTLVKKVFAPIDN